MWEYLALGDQRADARGGLLAEFTGGGAYALQPGGYVPLVNPRRPAGGLGGSGPYADVTEPLAVYARGATPAEALVWADRLLQIAERARRVRDLDFPASATTPVRLYAQAQCGQTRYDALVTDVGVDALVLSATPQQEGGWAVPLTLTITRGVWRAAGEEAGTSSGSAAQPAVQSVTWMGADQAESPARIAWGSFSATTLTSPITGVLLWAEQSAVALQPAPASGAWLPATGWSSVADAANNAPANLLRYTAAGTAEAPTGLDTMAGVHPLQPVRAMRRPLVLVVCRANSASGGFLLRAEGVSDGSDVTARTRMTPVPYAGGQPQTLALGVMTNWNYIGGMRLVAQATNAAGSPTLDISQVAVLDTASPYARAIWFAHNGSLHIANGIGAQAFESDAPDLGCDPIAALADTGGAALTFPLTRFSGDPAATVGSRLARPTGATMEGALLATHTQYWRLTASGPAAINATLRASRRRAQRVPQ